MENRWWFKEHWALIAWNKDTFEEDIDYQYFEFGGRHKSGILISRAKFRRPTGGINDFVAASLHFHHETAKEKVHRVVAALSEIRAKCVEHGVQIIAADLNKSTYDGPVETVFSEYITPEVPHRALWGMSSFPVKQQDCVGFLFPSRLARSGLDNQEHWHVAI